MFRQGQGIADFDFGRILDVGNHVADIARSEHVHLGHLRGKDADLFDFGFLVVAHQEHLVARLDRTGENPGVGDDAAVRVVQGIEYQRAGGRVMR